VATLKEWLTVANAEEKADLAQIALTSVPYLYQLANPDLVKSPSLATGLRLASGIVKLHERNPDLPLVSLQELANFPTLH
jgi:hypothetical protein